MDASTGEGLAAEPAIILSLLRKLLPADPDDPHDDAGVRSDTADDDDPRIEAGCTVWDLSADAQTASFMVEAGVITLILHPLSLPDHHPPRLLEICAGTAANLCAVCPAARAAFGSHPQAPRILSMLLERTADPPTLVELMRLLSSLLHERTEAAIAEATARDGAEDYTEAEADRDSDTVWQWLDELSTLPTLTSLTFILVNTLRNDLQLHAATLLSTMLYRRQSSAATIVGDSAHEHAASQVAGASALAIGERPSIAASLRATELVPSLCDLIIARATDGVTGSDADAATAAVLRLFDAAVRATDASLLPQHPIYPALTTLTGRNRGPATRGEACVALSTLVLQHADEQPSAGASGGTAADDDEPVDSAVDMPAAAPDATTVSQVAATEATGCLGSAFSSGKAVADGSAGSADGEAAGGETAGGEAADSALVPEAAGEELGNGAAARGGMPLLMLLNPQLIHTCIKLLQDAEIELGHTINDDNYAAMSCSDESLVSGVQGAWAILNSSATALDGFALCLPGLPPSLEHAIHVGAFSVFMRCARVLSRAARWTLRTECLCSIDEARAVVQCVIDAAGVVLTADSCTLALGGNHAAGAQEGGDEDESTMPGTAADFILRACNQLHAALGDEEEEESTDYNERRYEPISDDDDFLCPTGAMGMGTWASSDDDDDEHKT